MHTLRFAISLVLCSAVIACNSGASDASRRESRAPAVLPEVPASVIAVPITIDLAAFASAANATIPVEDIAKRTWNDDPGRRYRYRYAVRRSPVSISMNGALLTATATLDYQLQACGPWIGNVCPITVSCGWHPTRFDPPSKQGRIAIHSVLRLTPEYRVSSSTSAGPFTYTRANRCRLSFLDIDVTPLVARFIAHEMDDVSAQLDARAQRQLDFRGETERAWFAMQAPIDLGGGAYLQLNPGGIRASPLRGSGTIALTSLSISAQPEVVYGVPASAPAPAPLPMLDIAPAGDGFHVSVPVLLGFDSLSALLTREVAGTRLRRGRFLGIVPLSATIRSVRLFAMGDFVAAEVELSGMASGVVGLTARPRYEPETGRVALEGLDYDLARTGVVTRATGWILRSGLRDVLAAHATWDAADDIAAMRQRLDDALDRELAPGVLLSGDVYSLTAIGRGVYPSGESLAILLQADGAMRALVRPPDAN